jgi:hypothetical protein
MDDCLFSSALKTAQIDYHACRFSIYIQFATGFQPLISAGTEDAGDADSQDRCTSAICHFF